jgi:uncharacterized protein (DUF433 family)
MTKLVTEQVKGETYQYYPLGEHVVRAPEVCGGRPTFKYTRIEITGTLKRLATGENLEDLLTGYRGRVSRVAVMEAIQLVVVGWSERQRTPTSL